MLAADVVGHYFGVLGVYGAVLDAHGESAYGLAEVARGDGADEAGVQTAGEEEAHRHVALQPLDHTGREQLVDLAADGRLIVMTIAIGRERHVGVADELLAIVDVTRGEWHDRLTDARESLHLGGETYVALGRVAIEHSADSNGVPGGEELVMGLVIYDHGELTVQLARHLQQSLVRQERDDALAVAAALERVGRISLTERRAVENLAVAGEIDVARDERLIPGVGDVHYAEAVESHPAARQILLQSVVRPPVLDGVSLVAEPELGGQIAARVYCESTHDLLYLFLATKLRFIIKLANISSN